MQADNNDSIGESNPEDAQLNWNELDLSDDMLNALSDLGFATPTSVQQKTIPEAMRGRDLLVQAKTGSGKTLAFGLPIIEMLDPDEDRVQALVLTPTRELALQVATEIIRTGGMAEKAVVPVFGGASINLQIKKLRSGGKVVVGTPGRILDHISRGTLSLATARIVVLDEVDEMMDRGFLPDVNHILDMTPSEKQMMVFSATIPEDIRRIIIKRMRDPQHIQIGEAGYSVNYDVHHSFYRTQRLHKFMTLVNVLHSIPRTKTLIFTNTKSDCERVAEYLHKESFSVGFLDGDLSQAVRQLTLNLFKEGTLDVMVCTDVAARGIDIFGVSHVINYDLPENKEMYLHRTGRTGRAGRKGEAVSLVAPNELLLLGDIRKQLGLEVDEVEVPDKESVSANFKRTMIERLKSLEEEGYADDLSLLADELLESIEPYALTAGLLTYLRQRGFDLSSGYDVDNPEHKIRLFDRTPMLGKQDINQQMSQKRERRSSREGREGREDRKRRPAEDRPKREAASEEAGASDAEKPRARRIAKVYDPIWLKLERGSEGGLAGRPDVVSLVCQNCGVKKGWLGDCRINSDHVLLEVDSSVVGRIVDSMSSFKDERNIPISKTDAPSQ